MKRGVKNGFATNSSKVLTLQHTGLIYIPTSHGSSSVVMQACRYAALKWPCFAKLGDVIEHFCMYARSWPSLKISGEKPRLQTCFGEE